MTLCAPAAPGAFPQPMLMPCLEVPAIAPEELAPLEDAPLLDPVPPEPASIPLLPPSPPFELLPGNPPLLLLEPSPAGLPPELVAAPLLEPPLLDALPELLPSLPEPLETPPLEPCGPLSLLQAAATRRAAQEIAQTRGREFTGILLF
jgi:hypothetical protein